MKTLQRHPLFLAIAGAVSLLCVADDVNAQANEPILEDSTSQQEVVLKAVNVKSQQVAGQQLSGPQFDIKNTQTTFDLKAIQELQPSNVFDILADVPSVDLTGGPRANGISINIRGFGDNEDVLTIVDGAVKNFEKYRFGNVMPEPELLRELTVSRGPASVLQGSGAIGGVIEMETKDAADFLKNGDRFGGFVKLGYADNNNELLTIGSLYGRPTESTDALISFTKRDSDNLELSTGDELPYSAASPEAWLGKAEWTLDNAVFGISYSDTSTAGLELFDTSAFRNGVNGRVHRKTEDQTWASYLNFDPASEWIDGQVSIAYSDAHVEEQSIGANGQVLPRGWDFEYDIWSGRAHNKATLLSTSNQILALQFGVQAIEEKRTTRITDLNGNASTESQLSQPSGKTLNWGSYLQAVWDIYNVTATVGYRWDHNNSEVLQAESRTLLQTNGLPTRIEQREGLLNYRLDYHFESVPITLFHSYVEAARYPKLDEYFTQSNFSRCVRDSSSAEILVSQLQASQRETQANIANATQIANNNISTFTTTENTSRDNQIAALEAQRNAWITAGQAAVTNGLWTQAQYDAALVQTNQITDNSIAQVQSIAQNNIGFYSNQINNSLSSTVAALQGNYTAQLTAAGISDPNIDLANLAYPTKTTLPEPYESLQVCGALYEPERAKNREWGVAYASSALLTDDDKLQMKFTYYITKVKNLLESINTDPDDPASQPGKEKVWGYELESTYIIDGWRFDLAYNKGKGEISGFRLSDNPNGTNALDSSIYSYDTLKKYDMPADEIALTTRWISPNLAWEFGVRTSYKYSRDAKEFISDNSAEAVVVKQSSITQYDLFAGWKPLENTQLRLSVDNASNTRYKTPGGIGADGSLVLGNYNTGRNVKFSVTQYF